ncbi:MAG: hypothetical protein AAGC44_07065 [Planctomycetota bacterium]
MKRSFTPVLAFFAVFLSGCNQDMTIKVERLDVDPPPLSGEVEPLEMQVYLTGSLLQRVQIATASLKEIESAIVELGDKEGVLQGIDQKSSEELEKLILEGSRLIREIQRLGVHLNAADTFADGVDIALVRRLIIQTRLFLTDGDRYVRGIEVAIAKVIEEWQQEIDEIRSRVSDTRPLNNIESTRIQTLQGRIKVVRGMNTPIRETRYAYHSTKGSQWSFGGFSNTAIHTISPGDPMYDRVLRADPLPNAITRVRSHAYGDSTIMFVQESPTQMRVFSVDVDGTQLAQNIMLITDKALQAAVNYLSPAPLPAKPVNPLALPSGVGE